MAKLVPSAEMAKTENIGRIVTGPKPEKSSIRKSRSMAAFWPSFETPRKTADPQGKGFILQLGLMVRRRKAPSRTVATSQSASELRRHQLHRLAAAAGADLVGIVEDELGLHPVGLVVHLGAEQEQHGLGIDQDLDALVLDHFIGGTDLVRVLHRIGLSGAAAVLDSDPQTDDLGVRALGTFGDALGGGVGQPHHLRSRTRLR